MALGYRPITHFVLRGCCSVNYNSVNAFILTELDHQVVDLDIVECTRILWLTMDVVCANGCKNKVAICGFYAAPGGDVDTFRSLVYSSQMVRPKLPQASVITLGDSNVHLDYVVEHPEMCKCQHCRQTGVDRGIQERLQEVHLFAWNPPMATHVSGTIIDLVLGLKSEPRRVVVEDDWVGGSDHRLLYIEMGSQIRTLWLARRMAPCWLSGTTRKGSLAMAAPAVAARR